MPTTQPSPWTPEAVVTIIAVIAGTLIPSLIALIQAWKANAKANQATGQSTTNTQQIQGMQHQITAVALQTPPPAVPAQVNPVSLDDATLRPKP
jgi:hypothetical protein